MWKALDDLGGEYKVSEDNGIYTVSKTEVSEEI